MCLYVYASCSYIILMYFFVMCTAAPMTEYEKERAQHIMRNKQIFQRLGIGQLASLLKNVSANVEDDGPQKSGSEYSPHDNEGLEDDDEVINKV